MKKINKHINHKTEDVTYRAKFIKNFAFFLIFNYNFNKEKVLSE